jgi:VanZ family protein
VLNFIASSDLLSSGHTAVMLTYVLNLLHVHVQNVELLNHLLRKLGHFAAYAILGGLFFRAWRATLPDWRQAWRTEPSSGNPVGVLRQKLWTMRWSALAVSCAALAAAFDEWHQSFVPTRGSSVRDVLLDTLGAVFLQLILMVMWINKEVTSD